MITFTIPAFSILLITAFLGGIMLGVWLILNKIK